MKQELPMVCAVPGAYRTASVCLLPPNFRAVLVGSRRRSDKRRATEENYKR